MARRKVASSPRKRRSRGFRFSSLVPSATVRRRWYKRFTRAPTSVQVVVGLSVIVCVWMVLNLAYQVFRKPTELFFPISESMYKTPAETWDEYADLFKAHSTDAMTPEFLAALAQVEGSGNPVARTYWRWSLTYRPFDVYRPASSAVGMFQFTDGTFEEAKRYCIHDHKVATDGECWFNSLYTRTVPSHAVEMTSAYLDVRVSQTLARYRIAKASRQQKQELATLIHLCGAGAGAVYVRRGLKLAPGQQCGDHDARGYLQKVDTMKRTFAAFKARDDD